jgi:hypothetical protein
VKVPLFGLIATLATLTSIPCFASAPSRAKSQPYLLFNVLMPKEGMVVGTVSAHTAFDFSFQSRDRSDFVGLHAKLISKTPKGFRIYWSVVHRVHNKEIAHIGERMLIPWGATSKASKQLKSIPGYYVNVFYSDAPANEDSNATSA